MLNHITLYALITLQSPKVYLTVVTKKEHAVEYAQRILLLDHKSHFVQWCKYKNLMPSDPEAVRLYYKDCIPDQEKRNFKIIKFKPNKESIACSLRMFSGSIPLGCIYENPIEYKYITDKINRNEFTEDYLTLLQDAAEINPRIILKQEEINEQ